MKYVFNIRSHSSMLHARDSIQYLVKFKVYELLAIGICPQKKIIKLVKVQRTEK